MKIINQTICIIVFLASYIFAQPKNPIEPKPPVLEEKFLDSNKRSLNSQKGTKQHPAIIFFADGTKIRGAIFLDEEKLSSSCNFGNEMRPFEENIQNIKSIEFSNWKSNGRTNRFHHNTTTIVLRDGSKFHCTRIPCFDRFQFIRNGKKMWCYTFFYEYVNWKTIKNKNKNKYSKKDIVSPSSYINPHPHTVQKIEFLQEDSKNILEILPLLIK